MVTYRNERDYDRNYDERDDERRRRQRNERGGNSGRMGGNQGMDNRDPEPSRFEPDYNERDHGRMAYGSSEQDRYGRMNQGHTGNDYRSGSGQNEYADYRGDYDQERRFSRGGMYGGQGDMSGRSYEGSYGRSNMGQGDGSYGNFGMMGGYQHRTVQRGQHTGRGPKGYQRSDERIKDDVCERLTEHGDIDASDIEVSVANGEVTLQGMVDSRWTKRQAADILDDISGVRDVHNQLKVRQEQQNNQHTQGMQDGKQGMQSNQQRTVGGEH
jgi:osmotically-inducible protein OsmY